MTIALLSGVDWVEACSSYKDFDGVFCKCLTEMIQIGHDAVDDLLARYEAAIPGKSSQFIMLCDLRCYENWYSGRHDAAINWGRRGEALKEKTSVDTEFSAKHNLALALRDGGYVVEALESFLDGEALEEVIRSGSRLTEREAHFYGNVGRCLFLDDELDGARVCYIKSAQLLERDDGSGNRLNRGYIRLWIAELAVRREEWELAAASYRAAVCMWRDCSPPRSEEARGEWEGLVGRRAGLGENVEVVDWKAEEEYSQWLGGQ